MKKILIFVLFLYTYFISAQYNTQRIVVEIDNSQKYIYESTLNKLRLDSYKREVADNIKNYADQYFTELQKLTDFINTIDDKYKDLGQKEITRLTSNGNDILNLLNDLDKNDLTASKMKYVIEKSNNELSKFSETDAGKDLVIYAAISKFKKDLYPTVTDEVLFIMLKELSGVSENQFFKLYDEQYSKIPFRDFLIDQYERYFYIKNKYK